MLVDLSKLERAYFDKRPDVEDPNQLVHFGTSGHRGSSLRSSFNESHILAITQAICDYRRTHGTTGPLYLGKDTPPSTLHETALRLAPEAIVLSATVPEPFRRARGELAELAKLAPVMLAGPGAQRALAERVGASILAADPITAAYEIARDQARMRAPSGS